MKQIFEFKEAKDFIDMQNEIINDNIKYRQKWTTECKNVMRSYKWNKFPWKMENRKTWEQYIWKLSWYKVFLNLIKRQYRTTANYLLNNEPQFLITAIWNDIEESDLVSKRVFLENVFEWAKSDIEEITWFYDTVMDDVIFYWMFRWVVWTMCYYDESKQSYEFRSYDPMDTFIDLEARSLRNIKKWITTYTKNKNELKKLYHIDPFWTVIDWDNIDRNKNESEDDTKVSMLREKPNTNTLIVREWYYIEDNKMYRILTTAKQLLSKEVFEWINFLPITYFTAMNEPEELYPKGWYVDMLTLDKEINELILKINNIVKTWWRFVYIREWTTLTKWTSNFLNSLNIEVIEVADTQELPQQTALLQITQSDLQHLDFLMTQAEAEWWMKSDIMGTSSLWADASWKAIQALQAGSKNNIWPVLNELNKYMNRLVKVVLKLHDIYWEDETTIFWENWKITLNKQKFNSMKTKVSITWRNAFDEITKEAQALQILDLIAKFKPDIKISPNTITDIFWTTNDIATKIQADIDKEIDPDLQIAEGENKKLMNAVMLNANMTDNHQLHIAMHSELLKNFWPETDWWKAIINHLRMHQAMLEWWQQQ